MMKRWREKRAQKRASRERHRALRQELKQGPRSSTRSQENALGAWLASHRRAFVGVLIQLLRAPLGAFITWLAIAIALGIPLTAGTLLQHVDALLGGFDRAPRVNVFLPPRTDDAQGQQLAALLRDHEGVLALEYISAEQARQQFTSTNQDTALLEELAFNPFPITLVIEPVPALAKDVAALSAFAKELRETPGIDQVQLDRTWLERVHAIALLARYIVACLALLFGIGVIISIANAIRIEVSSRRQEIVVMKLIGASDRFIKRPFYHTGFMHGLCGGLLAAAIAYSAGLVLFPTLSRVFFSFGASVPQLIQWWWYGAVVALAVGLSVLGTAIALRREIRAIEPS